MSTVWMRCRTTWTSASRKAAAVRLSVFSTSPTTANLQVRSLATNRQSLPSAVLTLARLMWKKPIESVALFFHVATVFGLMSCRRPKALTVS